MRLIEVSPSPLNTNNHLFWHSQRQPLPEIEKERRKRCSHTHLHIMRWSSPIISYYSDRCFGQFTKESTPLRIFYKAGESLPRKFVKYNTGNHTFPSPPPPSLSLSDGFSQQAAARCVLPLLDIWDAPATIPIIGGGVGVFVLRRFVTAQS